MEFNSWGNFPKINKEFHFLPNSNSELKEFILNCHIKSLAVGLGRSYGDSCRNQGGDLILTSQFSKFKSFDEETGLLECESGVSFEEILNVFVPKGWFLPVTPGTKFVTVGGAIANDVHGKNHHKSGSFGCFLKEFILFHKGTFLRCSELENKELFYATIGGLGLTGFIESAKIQLKRIKSTLIQQEAIQLKNVHEFFEVNEESEKNFEYTVAWIDCLSKGAHLGRGVYLRGNHFDGESKKMNLIEYKPQKINIPFNFPSWTLNRFSVKIFNELYYHKQLFKKVSKLINYDPFFYPLDSIHNWNRIYGKNGFYQYQFVVPNNKNGQNAILKILEIISKSGQASFLSVLKTFGSKSSGGLLSFPRPGITLALDFPNRGALTESLFQRLDEHVFSAGGALYPAKDARMSKESFALSFPHFRKFEPFIDEKFSSSFIRRVL